MRRSDPYGDAFDAYPARGTSNRNFERFDPSRDTIESTSRDYSSRQSPENDDSKGFFGNIVSFVRGSVDMIRSPGNTTLDRRSNHRSISMATILIIALLIVIIISGSGLMLKKYAFSSSDTKRPRPEYVFDHPYVSSSYYLATESMETLEKIYEFQVKPKAEQLAGRKRRPGEKDFLRETKTRLAIVRPFCAFDAAALPTTFECWQQFCPCRAAAADLGDGFDEAFYADETRRFDNVGSHMQKGAKADVFLFYSQTFSDSETAMGSVDSIMSTYFEGGGWAKCFDAIYAIEANIPPELDLYLPPAQETLYNWVNGPNRQFEAAVRIIQSGEWGDYDGFYLMEGDSIPIKAYWLDVLLSEIEVNRPFAILGAKYNGDKWDNFYEQIPIPLLDHTNGNAIYNTSHPLLERLVGQLEVEAPCPYNSIPYDYRMSQMWIEGTMSIVPKLSPIIMLNEEGENITLSNNTAMFKKWADVWEHTHPFKETPVIHNYAATNLIPRHLGPEYIIHGAKLYAPWDPSKTEITLVVSEWYFDRSSALLETLDERDHPFSQVIIMLPPTVDAHEDYSNLTIVPTRSQHRESADYMDLCTAEVTTDWFMFTNSYHVVANHVDLMFTPGKGQPVVPFTPATIPFCFKYPYCGETVNLARKFKPGHKKVVLDFDMLYHTETRNAFCKEWRDMYGDEGEDLYKDRKRPMRRKKVIGPPGPTGTSYTAYLYKVKKEGMYKLIDRSLYGARAPFIKKFGLEEKLDGMTEEELALKMGMGTDNVTDCNCFVFETEAECSSSPLGCIWRPLFESCHPPELVDEGNPICPTTTAPTFSPTESFEPTNKPTISPTASAPPVPGERWLSHFFRVKEHEYASMDIDGEEDEL